MSFHPTSSPLDAISLKMEDGMHDAQHHQWILFWTRDCEFPDKHITYLNLYRLFIGICNGMENPDNGMCIMENIIQHQTKILSAHQNVR